MSDELRYPFDRIHEEVHIPDGNGFDRWVYLDGKLTYMDLDAELYIERRRPTEPHGEVGCVFLNLGRNHSMNTPEYYYREDPEARAYADTHLGGRDFA